MDDFGEANACCRIPLRNQAFLVVDVYELNTRDRLSSKYCIQIIPPGFGVLINLRLGNNAVLVTLL